MCPWLSVLQSGRGHLLIKEHLPSTVLKRLGSRGDTHPLLARPPQAPAPCSSAHINKSKTCSRQLSSSELSARAASRQLPALRL